MKQQRQEWNDSQEITGAPGRQQANAPASPRSPARRPECLPSKTATPDSTQTVKDSDALPTKPATHSSPLKGKTRGRCARQQMDEPPARDRREMSNCAVSLPPTAR